MKADLIPQAEAARELGEQPYVIHVIAHFQGIPLYRHPLNGNARCFDRDDMARLATGVERYRQNRKVAEASLSA